MEAVGTLVGIKSFINEFAAYDALRSMGDSISERSRVIATYALCGFSNPASIGIQVVFKLWLNLLIDSMLRDGPFDFMTI